MVSPNNCQHKNIAWEDFFKKEKKKKINCADCGTDNGKLFASKAQRWYCKKIEEWLTNNGLTEKIGNYNSTFQFRKFLKKNNFYEQWDELSRGKFEKDFNGFLEQMPFWEVAKSIEYLCLEFKKEKQNNPNTPQPRKGKDKRERERERANSTRY